MRQLAVVTVLVVLAVVGGIACSYEGYGPFSMYGKNWLRYRAKAITDTDWTYNVGACEAYYNSTKAKWYCINGTYGVWKQRARLNPDNCAVDWDTGNVITCPPSFKVWDDAGVSGAENGQRGPL